MGRNYLAALLSATLLVLPFHFGALGFLAFFAFVPLFFAISGKSGGQVFQLSFVCGVFFFAFLGYWLNFVNVLGFILLVLYLALYFGIFGYFAAKFFGSPVKCVIYIPAFWTALEYIRGFLFSGMPWGLLGNSQWKQILWIQFADITGVWGVSFFIVAVNVLIFKIIELKPAPALQRRLGVILAGVLLVVSAYGLYSLRSWDAFYNSSAKKAVVRVGLVQGNIPQEQKWDARIKNIIFEKYKRLTLMAASQKPDLIVWPETSFPGYLEDEPVMAASLRNLVRLSQTNVLVGAPTFGDLEKGLKFYNSAVFYGPDGEERLRYGKMHLVPFGEYVPFGPVLGFLHHLFPIGHFSAGENQAVFEMQPKYSTPGVTVRFSSLICYEDIFPGLVRKFCNKGANFLVNITNDAWFGKTTAPYQHAQGSILRAVENRVPVVRATNTGLSCFISQTGKITATVEDKGEEILVTGYKVEALTLKKTRPFYTRFGDVFMLLVVGLCIWAYKDRSAQYDYSRL